MTKKIETIVQVTGEPKKDLSNLRIKDIDFQIRVIEYYVPNKTDLIAYCKSGNAPRDYILENAKIILNARI